ncbi:MAG: pyruvate synthase subunit beta [Armatimonadetes bacterium]|nr:pyruvate synthase subunit beta [Armatimonadota bacterium]
MNPISPERTYALPEGEEILCSGHYACPGCGVMPLARMLLRILGRRTVIVAPACCFAVIDGPFPFSSTGVPLLHAAFEAGSSYASGVRAGLDKLGESDLHVVVIAGDGGTFDIGLQALSAAAERNENLIYICYDNEAYMNTGIQRSSATPIRAWTTTTPRANPKSEPKKDLGAIMIAHRIPYFATGSLAYPEDLYAKLERMSRTEGFRMLHYFSPCPTGWKAEACEMVHLARLAVETRVFPLYESENGEAPRLTVDVPPQPIQQYLEIQGRFRHLTPEDSALIQEQVDRGFARFLPRQDG